jgi:signal transduction histidine kinase
MDIEEEQEKEFLGSINKVSDQMLHLLNDLLDVSAIESGKFEIKWQEGNLGELLKSRIELVNFSAKAKNITITTDISDVPDIEFDFSRIGQVIDNLLTNAVKFSPPDTVIDTSVRFDDSEISVMVKDHGQGIPASEIDKIFDAFAKLSTQPTEGEKSTGLGMAIVKKIVDAHGGDINVESTEGEGSTFTISLPRIAKNKEGE